MAFLYVCPLSFRSTCQWATCRWTRQTCPRSLAASVNLIRKTRAVPTRSAWIACWCMSAAPLCAQPKRPAAISASKSASIRRALHIAQSHEAGGSRHWWILKRWALCQGLEVQGTEVSFCTLCQGLNSKGLKSVFVTWLNHCTVGVFSHNIRQKIYFLFFCFFRTKYQPCFLTYVY